MKINELRLNQRKTLPQITGAVEVLLTPEKAQGRAQVKAMDLDLVTMAVTVTTKHDTQFVLPGNAYQCAVFDAPAKAESPAPRVTPESVAAKVDATEASEPESAGEETGEGLSALSIVELRKAAAKAGISGSSRMRKDDIVAALEAAD